MLVSCLSAPNPPFCTLQCQGWDSAKFVSALAVALCESVKMEGLTEAARPEEGEGACPFLPASHSSQLNLATFSWQLVPTAFNSTLFFPPGPQSQPHCTPLGSTSSTSQCPRPSRLRSQLCRVSSPSLEVLITPKKWFRRLLNLSHLEAC